MLGVTPDTSFPQNGVLDIIGDKASENIQWVNHSLILNYSLIVNHSLIVSHSLIATEGSSDTFKEDVKSTLNTFMLGNSCNSNSIHT